MPLVLDESQTLLTPKEARVLLLLAQGRTHKQMAKILYRAECTIKTHVEHISVKLGSLNAANAVMVAFEKGIFKMLPCLLMGLMAFGCVVGGWWLVER